MVPTGYLEVAGLDDVCYRELTDRYRWLVDAIKAAGPGAGHPGILPAGLALVAVITELDTRASRYRRNADRPCWCSCGFYCIGLAEFEQHLDNYPPEGPDGHAHNEEPRDGYLADQAAATGQDGDT